MRAQLEADRWPAELKACDDFESQELGCKRDLMLLLRYILDANQAAWLLGGRGEILVCCAWRAVCAVTQLVCMLALQTQ